MKSILLHLMMLLPVLGFAQVGIGTTDPTAMLDVNGNFRLRSTTSNTRATAAKDSILVVDALGNAQRISSKSVIESHLKTFIKGGFATGSPALINISILANAYTTIPFNTIEFDTNSEYNTTTNTFTAKQPGIYSVYAAIKASPGLVAAGDFGLAIFKNGAINVRESYMNVQLLGININPPNRSIQTLMQLNTGDTITFRGYSGGVLTVGILSGGEESYFTIHQVR